MANKNPPDNTGKKYNVSEFTPKQEKFIVYKGSFFDL